VFFIVAFFIAVFTFGVIPYSANVNASDVKNEEQGALSLQPLITNLPSSWGLNVSPDNFLFVTHRSGTLAKYSLSGELLATIDLQLDDLYYKGQGGLSAIAFHPDFASTPWIYLSYSYGSDSGNGLKVIRVLLSDKESASANNAFSVASKETIFEQADLRGTAAHYGARLAFMSDRSLLISTGDGSDYREYAQKTSSDMGKILRLTDTGGIPNNNPFAKAQSFSEKAIYSLGHRNPQGLIVMPSDQIIAHEHGPAGGDEINIIKPGFNYGWPVITQGKDYIGSLITPFTQYEGMQQPNVNWTPSIAPSGMVFYDADALPSFANSLLITSLKFKQLHVLALNGEIIENEVIFFADSQHRMRDIAVSNNGRVFILSDGKLATIFEVVMTQ
jgi:glucose/arabinose dehydrogenase